MVGTETRAPQPRGFTPDGIIKAATAYRMGFICDLSNPKVVIFFGAIFANFIETFMPRWIQKRANYDLAA